MDQTKIEKTTKVIDRLLKILQGFASAACIVCAVFIVLVLILGEKMVADASSLKMGVVTLRLADSACLMPERLKGCICAELAAAILIAGVFWFGVRQLRSILAPMKDGRPFDAGISDKIRRLGWIVLIGGTVSEIARTLSHVFEVKAYDFASFLNPASVSGFEYDFSIDLSFVVAALVIFLLSHIFRYGEVLQQESDETL